MTASTLYRGNLPHFRSPGAIYFVTWRLRPGSSPFVAVERDCVTAALRHFDRNRYRLDAFVVMDDHVHVLVKPADDKALQAIVHSWKSYTANKIQRLRCRRGSLWQDEYFDRAVRNESEYAEKRDYILNNPFRRWPALERYAWLWAIGLDEHAVGHEPASAR